MAQGSPLASPAELWRIACLEAFQLPSSGQALLLQGNRLVYCFEINARVIAALCSFVCLFVCLFQEPGKIPEEEKLLTNCAAISFF